MFNGRIVGVLPRSEATAERLGAMMTGSISTEGEKRRKGEGEGDVGALLAAPNITKASPAAGTEKSSEQEDSS